jgi:hypothetical protein
VSAAAGEPDPRHTGPISARLACAGILAGLVGSAVALLAAPALMPSSYSWVSQTTSESAAQGVDGAWLARLGFLLFGLSVLWLAQRAEPAWGWWAAAAHRAFGVLLAAAAAFSHRPWERGASFDRTEDLLHSIAATAMGFAFTLGIIAVALRRVRQSRHPALLDGIAVVAACLIPLGMSVWGSHAGILQRLLFVVGYVWYAREALRWGAVSSGNAGHPGRGSR